MDTNEKQPPHNPYAPSLDEPAPNQYGQYSNQIASTQPSYQSVPTASVSSGDTTASTRLSVDVVAPTHFDNQPPVAPVSQPVAPRPMETKKPSVKLAIVLVPSIFALVFLVFGVWATFSMLMKDDQLKNAQQILANQSEIIAAIEQKTGTTISDANDLPNVVALGDYIYINDWRIKLRIPNNLSSISYILNQNYRQTICFNAKQADIATFPAFADVRQNPGGMGCLIRVSNQEGDIDSSNNTRFGTHVFSANGYNYFYVAPTVTYSTDPGEQGQENTAVQLIKTMLSSENISTY